MEKSDFFSLPALYVVGTQKNLINDTDLLSTPKHIFKLMDKETIAILRLKIILIWAYGGAIYENHLLVLAYLVLCLSCQ